VIGNCAPDVVFVDGPQVAPWAEQGLLLPLDDLLKQRGIDLEKFSAEFFEPCWKQCVSAGGCTPSPIVPTRISPSSGNKDAFESAIAAGEIPPGTLDPDKAPATLEELDRWNHAITKFEGTGPNRRLVRLGLVPWGVYGRANSIFTWGWAFGGEFYDAENFKVTANHPKIVEALEWMCEYGRRYDPERVSALQSTFGSAEQNPFILGRQAIQLLHLSGLDDLDRYAPRLRYGMGPIPQPPGGELNSSWVGGWTLAIPATVSDPRRLEAALDYILWACAEAEGTTVEVRSIRNFPAWKPAPFFEEARKDPRMGIYVQILESAKHQRPVMAAQAYYMSELDRAVDRAVRGVVTPQAALDEATRRTQEYLDKMLARYGGRP